MYEEKFVIPGKSEVPPLGVRVCRARPAPPRRGGARAQPLRPLDHSAAQEQRARQEQSYNNNLCNNYYIYIFLNIYKN